MNLSSAQRLKEQVKRSIEGRIKVRRPQFNFPLGIPRHWLDNSPFRTHLLNSFTLIFPEGEKFFIRSIEHYSHLIKDPVLKEEVRAFMRQETQHYLAHEKFLKNMTLQGYKINPLLKFVEFMTKDILEPFMGPKMNLSITAGLEHFTALLAEIGLKEKFLENAEPEMRRLFEWHAAEEIEHKAVAFDVLQTIDDSYALRVAGLLNAYFILSGFSTLFTVSLLIQDGKALDKETIKEAADVLLVKQKLFLKSISIFLRYLHPDFHPNNEGVDIVGLAQAVFSRLQSQAA